MRIPMILVLLITSTTAFASPTDIMHFKYNCVVKELGAGSTLFNIAVGSPAAVETTTGRENGSTATGPNILKIGSGMIVGTAGRYSYTERPMRNIFEFIGSPQKVAVNLINRSNYTGKSALSVYVNDQKVAGLICADAQ